MTPADKFYVERRSVPRADPEPLEPSPMFLWITGLTISAILVSVVAWVVSIG